MLYHYILQYCLPVEHANDAMAVACIVFAVRNHHNGGALFVKIGKQGHHFVTIAAVEVTGRLIGQYQFGIIYNGPCHGQSSQPDDR